MRCNTHQATMSLLNHLPCSGYWQKRPPAPATTPLQHAPHILLPARRRLISEAVAGVAAAAEQQQQQAQHQSLIVEVLGHDEPVQQQQLDSGDMGDESSFEAMGVADMLVVCVGACGHGCGCMCVTRGSGCSSRAIHNSPHSAFTSAET